MTQRSQTCSLRCNGPTGATSTEEETNAMDIKRVALIGTEPLGVSLALAVKALDEAPDIVVYAPDARSDETSAIREMFDHVVRRPEKACGEADLIILAMPLSVMRYTLTEIAPHTPPGCIVTDTAHLKAPVMHWAEEILPQHVHFIGGHPIPNLLAAGFETPTRVSSATPRLMQGALHCLTVSSGLPAAVVGSVTELIEAVGAQPFFVDALEHDGLQSGVEDLPALLAIVLLNTTAGTPGWQDMCRFAGLGFAGATDATVDTDTTERSLGLYLNRAHAVTRINALLRELILLRDALSGDDVTAIEDMVGTAAEHRAAWLAQLSAAQRAAAPTASMDQVPTAGQHMLGRLLFGERLMNRLGGRDNRRGRS